MNWGSGQQGRSLYSSFNYRLKLGFGRPFRGAYNQFWNVLLGKDTQVWANEVLMIRELQASRSTGDALNYRHLTLSSCKSQDVCISIFVIFMSKFLYESDLEMVFVPCS